MIRRRRITLISSSLVLAGAADAVAQEPASEDGQAAAGGDSTALAKQTQNPVSDLISVPLQFNFNSGGGLNDRSLVNLNVQPVIPMNVTSNWNVVSRTIIPFFNLPQGIDGDTGLGDIQEQLFLSPARPGSVTWGIGPIFSFPTATLEALRTGSWAIGPAAVVLTSPGPWVVGALATQRWTFADFGDERDVDAFLLQPFVNYNFGRGWAATSAPIITADWGADGDDRWTVPIGGGMSLTTKVGGQAIQFGAQYYYNVTHPDAGAQNLLRLQVSLLFPKAPEKTSSAVAGAGGPESRPEQQAMTTTCE